MLSETPTTELEAANQVLAGIGEAPVSSTVDHGLSDAATAIQTLRNVSRQMQSKGWHFNTEKEFPLAPQVNTGHIEPPRNTLKVDSSGVDQDVDVVLRGQRLYNRTTRSYSFDRPILVDLVLMLPFEELPEAARNYVTLSARRRYQEDQLGSDSLSTFHRRDELQAWADLMHYEADTADHSLKDNLEVREALNR